MAPELLTLYHASKHLWKCGRAFDMWCEKSYETAYEDLRRLYKQRSIELYGEIVVPREAFSELGRSR